MIDTNVLVYGYDRRDPWKAGVANELIARLAASRRAVLPAQVLAEFSRVALSRFRPPPTPDRLASQLERLRLSFTVLPLTSAVVLEAVRGVRDHGFSYYDAQIWAAARLAQASVVYSEDFSHGSTVEGVTFIDPFRPDRAVAPPLGVHDAALEPEARP